MFDLDGCKLKWHIERVSDWKQGKRIAPITMDIALTRACNYKCVYCYSQLQENESKPMTWEVIKRFLEDAKEIGVKAISLVSDGESTCSPHYINTIIYGNYFGLDMAMGTNGYLLDQNALKKILPNLKYLRFNISGSTPEIYAKWHGVNTLVYFKVIENIKTAVKLKKDFDFPVTIGMQMVYLPEMASDVVSLAKLGRDLGVDYFVIKHCSDDENNTLQKISHINFDEMDVDELKAAEKISTEKYKVAVKWSKILNRKRCYSRCYAAQFIMQISGSGLVAPCGMLFNEKYKKYHIGNIAETRFMYLFYSDRYKEVMDELASDRFDAKTMCGSLCLQHKCNEFLNSLMEIPEHVNFI